MVGLTEVAALSSQQCSSAEVVACHFPPTVSAEKTECVCVCVRARMCVRVLKTVCGVFFRKDTKVLGTFWKKGVPIEVVPMAYRPIQNKIVKELGGKCELRMANRKAVRK